MPQSAAIFDVDGVLIDSYQPHFQGWVQMLAELGEPYTEAMFHDDFGRTNSDIFADRFSGKFSAKQVLTASNRKEALYREIVRHDFPEIEGAKRLVDSLDAKGFALAVGSSGPPENVALAIECLGCTEQFTTRVTGADVTRGKPDPQVFLLAAKKLGVAPANCVVFEDAPAGVAAAKAAGMSCIALLGTATHKQLSQADLVVASLLEVTIETVQQILSSC